MELGNQNVNLTKEYNNKLTELDESIKLLLEDFKKNYVLAEMNPDNEEIQERYDNVISNINQAKAKLFSISNDIQFNINNVNKKLLEIDDLIKNEKNKNNNLKRKLGIVEDKHMSSLEMISDYRYIYEINYLRNWGLFLSTIICLYTINIAYKKPVV
jgi:predicted choloylglycine hydrolase